MPPVKQRASDGSEVEAPMPLYVYAMMARAAYDLTSDDNVELVNAAAACLGFQTGYTEPEDVDAEVLVAYRTVDGQKHLLLAYRGTEFEATKNGFKDAMADFGIVGGNYDQEGFKRRQAVTEAAIAKHKPDYVDLTGHSLGGTAAMHCLFQSKPLQARLRYAALFNEFVGLPWKGSSGAYALDHDSELYKKLHSAVVHYRTKLDLASASLSPPAFGKVVPLEKESYLQLLASLARDKGKDAMAYVRRGGPQAGVAHQMSKVLPAAAFAAGGILNTILWYKDEVHNVSSFIPGSEEAEQKACARERIKKSCRKRASMRAKGSGPKRNPKVCSDEALADYRGAAIREIAVAICGARRGAGNS